MARDYAWISEIVRAVEPLSDDIYGDRYRCSLTLKDGTFLPCAVLQSKSRLVELAKRRFSQETNPETALRGPDPYGQIVSTFVAGGNRVNDYAVRSATVSRYAIPQSLLSRIHGETLMAWTGWVFEMNDGRLFSYGTTFHFEFFDLPEGYGFEDVKEVHNHSFVDSQGSIRPLRPKMPDDYDRATIFRERVFFNCAIDAI